MQGKIEPPAGLLRKILCGAVLTLITLGCASERKPTPANSDILFGYTGPTPANSDILFGYTGPTPAKPNEPSSYSKKQYNTKAASTAIGGVLRSRALTDSELPMNKKVENYKVGETVEIIGSIPK